MALCVIIFCLPFSPEGVPWESAFNWSAVNYAPIVTIGVMLAVTIWYAVRAKKTFKGPIRTIDELDVESALPAIAAGPLGGIAMIAPAWAPQPRQSRTG